MDNLDTILDKIQKAKASGDREELLSLMELHSDVLVDALKSLLEREDDKVNEGLSASERDFLVKAYKNAAVGTPKLTEIESDEQFEVAKVLSERGLMTFTSIPSFVLITKRGMRYVKSMDKSSGSHS